jgi:hypothetical protein
MQLMVWGENWRQAGVSLMGGDGGFVLKDFLS